MNHIPVASRETVNCPERTKRTYRPWGRFEVRLTRTPPTYINRNPANTEIPHFRAAGLPETPRNTEYSLLVLLHRVISWWVVLMGDMRIFIPQLARYQYRQSRRERKRLVASIHRQQRPSSLSWASTFVVCCVLCAAFIFFPMGGYKLHFSSEVARTYQPPLSVVLSNSRSRVPPPAISCPQPAP